MWEVVGIYVGTIALVLFLLRGSRVSGSIVHTVTQTQIASNGSIQSQSAGNNSIQVGRDLNMGRTSTPIPVPAPRMPRPRTDVNLTIGLDTLSQMIIAMADLQPGQAMHLPGDAGDVYIHLRTEKEEKAYKELEARTRKI